MKNFTIILCFFIAQQLLAQGNVSIQNAWQQTYLQADSEKPSLGVQSNKAVWVIEKIASSTEVRLKHLASGGYLNAEKDAKFPSIGAIEPGWWSAMWILEPVAGTDQLRLQNKWWSTYLHTESGAIELGTIQPGWASARWKIQPGSNNTTTPTATNKQPFNTVPLGGNTFFSNFGASGIELSIQGIQNWTGATVVPTVYVRFLEKGTYTLNIVAKAAQQSTINVGIQSKNVKVAVNSPDWKKYPLGSFTLEAGYLPIVLNGLIRTGTKFADIQAIEIQGDPAKIKFVDATLTGSAQDSYYFGRRGPSVHMSYTLPAGKNIEWFYNEVTVPSGNDVIGSYFMVNGFAEGYCGIQVNSATERRVLFSVWSPYTTDDPGSIPADQRVKLLGKGPGVNAQDFGGEGSGGQSYLVYNWKAGQTYKFLTRVYPNGDNTTTYSAYFFDPATKNWRFIASFKRPKTSTWYKSPHSFLENFDPERGALTRKVFYNNQWVCDAQGNWSEMTEARFTNDDTGRKKLRMDFNGGVENKQFFLRNCGFFNNFTDPNSMFKRTPGGKKPVINFAQLPK
ncbi:DUF3472 domain-containing protein [Haliscomenobacter hydrossis]|uniref:DUF5077 domain-containing protein n=1 Tax=Haliscomenobacter hydrossis (strain ATCC 27775 / DSM 1100 / LMG 10767 / O) TaxID=760192 RepID=F4KQW4_HALH1|nr:DUF3472 domain-containing protein [Haliscomenobacter hydrossis]AEE52249.1 hypothetical protein Halhy_4405 [Haliscomenobacter hydrossis DSM 1100]